MKLIAQTVTQKHFEAFGHIKLQILVAQARQQETNAALLASLALCGVCSYLEGTAGIRISKALLASETTHTKNNPVKRRPPAHVPYRVPVKLQYTSLNCPEQQ